MNKKKQNSEIQTRHHRINQEAIQAIENLRSEAGMTVAALCKKAEITPQMYRNYQKGSMAPYAVILCLYGSLGVVACMGSDLKIVF